jgi:hypothetical protein
VDPEDISKRICIGVLNLQEGYPRAPKFIMSNNIYVFMDECPATMITLLYYWKAVDELR